MCSRESPCLRVHRFLGEAEPPHISDSAPASLYHLFSSRLRGFACRGGGCAVLPISAPFVYLYFEEFIKMSLRRPPVFNGWMN